MLWSYFLVCVLSFGIGYSIANAITYIGTGNLRCVAWFLLVVPIIWLIFLIVGGKDLSFRITTPQDLIGFIVVFLFMLAGCFFRLWKKYPKHNC